MRQYEIFELEFIAATPQISYTNVDLLAKFDTPDGTIMVRGFYAGNNKYKIRFLPQRAGHYTWSVSGVIHAEGEADCAPHVSERRGIVRVDGTHFRFENGSWFWPFGTTVYALLHQKQELVEQTMETLSHAPFNKIRFCVFPKHYDYNHNEPELFPFERDGDGWNVDHPVPAFWDHLELRLLQLDEMGIQADLILFHPYDCWGFAQLSKDQCLTYLDYAVRRLAAFPNLWWSLANEYDLMDSFPTDWWAEFAAFLNKNDKFGHLLSNHNCMAYWDFDNPHTTHCCIQDSRVGEVGHLLERYKKPVIFDECCYEGTIPYDWGNISPFEMVHRFWMVVTAGGYCTHGETYLTDEEVLWWGKGGVLHGESPRRIEFLRQIMESLPGPVEHISGPMDLSQEKISQIKAHPEFLDTLPADFRRFAKGIIEQPPEWIAEFQNRCREPMGHYQTEYYIKYLGKHCTCMTELDLPETQCYRIEVIDIWEMTRTEVSGATSGKVTVKLPGKEGIAVLATAIKK